MKILFRILFILLCIVCFWEFKMIQEYKNLEKSNKKYIDYLMTKQVR